ncbi:hypothetical protein FRC10_004652 [Ceratobasidium sp. 414]|nr:hypothetical protein FRC10_004652 [Ceratobasidium sp. 414]
MSGTQIVSQYAYNKPKGMHWSPRPLALAKRYPLRSIAERTSAARRSTAAQVVQPVVKVQDEYYEEGALIEPEIEGGLNSGDPNSPAVSTRDLPTSHLGVSPEDFLRHALPVTYAFVSAPPVDHRLGVTSPHRLRPSSSMSNLSSGSIKSRPPSVMSTNGQIRRSSSRTSGFSDPPVSTSSLAAAS